MKLTQAHFFLNSSITKGYIIRREFPSNLGSYTCFPGKTDINNFLYIFPKNFNMNKQINMCAIFLCKMRLYFCTLLSLTYLEVFQYQHIQFFFNVFHYNGVNNLTNHIKEHLGCFSFSGFTNNMIIRILAHTFLHIWIRIMGYDPKN